MSTVASMPPHLRPPRMLIRIGPGGAIEPEPDYDVDDILLTGVRLATAARASR